jgi:hypothetical protein
LGGQQGRDEQHRDDRSRQIMSARADVR